MATRTTQGCAHVRLVLINDFLCPVRPTAATRAASSRPDESCQPLELRSVATRRRLQMNARNFCCSYFDITFDPDFASAGGSQPARRRLVAGLLTQWRRRRRETVAVGRLPGAGLGSTADSWRLAAARWAGGDKAGQKSDWRQQSPALLSARCQDANETQTSAPNVTIFSASIAACHRRRHLVAKKRQPGVSLLK